MTKRKIDLLNYLLMMMTQIERKSSDLLVNYANVYIGVLTDDTGVVMDFVDEIDDITLKTYTGFWINEKQS